MQWRDEWRDKWGDKIRKKTTLSYSLIAKKKQKIGCFCVFEGT